MCLPAPTIPPSSTLVIINFSFQMSTSRYMYVYMYMYVYVYLSICFDSCYLRRKSTIYVLSTQKHLKTGIYYTLVITTLYHIPLTLSLSPSLSLSLSFSLPLFLSLSFPPSLVPRSRCILSSLLFTAQPLLMTILFSSDQLIKFKCSTRKLFPLERHQSTQ